MSLISGAHSRSSPAMVLRTSRRAPAGQASIAHSRPMALPVTTSRIRASASRQDAGAIWENAVATTSVNRPCAQAMPSSGPSAKASSMPGARSTA